MPPGAKALPVSIASLRSPSVTSLARSASSTKISTPLSGGFAPYEIEDEDTKDGRMSTPEPIRVIKVKKKKASTKKKARDQEI